MHMCFSDMLDVSKETQGIWWYRLTGGTAKYNNHTHGQRQIGSNCNVWYCQDWYHPQDHLPCQFKGGGGSLSFQKGMMTYLSALSWTTRHVHIVLHAHVLRTVDTDIITIGCQDVCKGATVLLLYLNATWGPWWGRDLLIYWYIDLLIYRSIALSIDWSIRILSWPQDTVICSQPVYSLTHNLVASCQ